MKYFEILKNILWKFKTPELEKRNYLRILSELINQIIFQVILLSIIGISVVYLIQYFSVFNSSQLSPNIEDFSGFGSYLSGLGSILSVFTLIFIIWTYRHDKERNTVIYEETKLQKYLDYIINIKANLKFSYDSVDYPSSVLLENMRNFIILAPKNIDISSLDKKKKKEYSKHQSFLLHSSVSYIPLQNYFVMTIKYIYYESIYLSRKDSMKLLMSLFTFDEIVVLLYIFSWKEENDKEIIEILFEYDEKNKTVFEKCKAADSFYNKTSFE
jgi:hypothetical protein